MDKCGQACPYNTLDGCKVKEYRAICPLTNMATPITEYKMTNADRIRSMTDEELAKWIDWFLGRCEWCDTDKMGTDDCSDVSCTPCILNWLQQPAEEDNHE